MRLVPIVPVRLSFGRPTCLSSSPSLHLWTYLPVMSVPRVLVVGGNGFLGMLLLTWPDDPADRGPTARICDLQSRRRKRLSSLQHEVRPPFSPISFTGSAKLIKSLTNPSSSGKPYLTPSGHSPKWVDSVTWHAASTFDPPSYTALVASSSAVVHTLGILLEDAAYKQSIRDGDVLGLLRAFIGLGSGSGEVGNGPLKKRWERTGYEAMNRDSGGFRSPVLRGVVLNCGVV